MREKLSETLEERGQVYQFSSETLGEITDGDKRVVYFGIDPSADSIHVGNLAGYMLARRFLDAGHKIILLFGGGTGMIGDPKPDVERPLVEREVIAERIEKITAQASALFGGKEVIAVNNADWLAGLNLIEFLRDVGKHFTVNNLIKKDAIATRLSSEEGISYTEFAYPLLQAYDYLHLHKEFGCDVQIGGSDQWGNITAGVELIRRKEGKTVYALSLPLVIDKATGKKFGKSEGNAIWLDPNKTSPFVFYQFWLNVSDDSVGDYLKIFTMLSMEEIEKIMGSHTKEPAARTAQRTLAKEVTTLVHTAETAQAVEQVSEVLFGSGDMESLDEEGKALLQKEAPSCVTRAGESFVDSLVSAGLASSKREAREFIEQGAVTLNGAKVTDVNRSIMAEDFQNASIALAKRGKRNVCVLVQG